MSGCNSLVQSFSALRFHSALRLRCPPLASLAGTHSLHSLTHHHDSMTRLESVPRDDSMMTRLMVVSAASARNPWQSAAWPSPALLQKQLKKGNKSSVAAIFSLQKNSTCHGSRARHCIIHRTHMQPAAARTCMWRLQLLPLPVAAAAGAAATVTATTTIRAGNVTHSRRGRMPKEMPYSKM